MHELFSMDSSVIIGVFRSLIELKRRNSSNGSPHFLLANISSILLNRSRLARVCRQWLGILSDIQILSLTSLHFNAFGCHGTATEIFARYTALDECHSVACNHKAFLGKPTIVNFFNLPWRLRLAKLGIFFQRSDTFNREMYEAELARLQDLLSPQTVAIVERAFADFPSGANDLTRRLQSTYRCPHTEYELLNFTSGYQDGITPDEFVAVFNNSDVYIWKDLEHKHGFPWPVKTMGCEIKAQLQSALCFAPQNGYEVEGTCIFTFQNKSFRTIMRVFLGLRLDLTFAFINMPNS